MDYRQFDDAAIAAFARRMSRKMEASRAKGREGWRTCPVERLWELLREHVGKGDPVDVAIFAMMIEFNAREGVLTAAPTAEDGLPAFVRPGDWKDPSPCPIIGPRQHPYGGCNAYFVRDPDTGEQRIYPDMAAAEPIMREWGIHPAG